MEKLIVAVLLAGAAFAIVLSPSEPLPPTDPGVVAALEQLERDFANATVAGDVDRLNQLLADDWKSTGTCGEVYTKETLLHEVKSARKKRQSLELGAMDVQVLGDVAAAHGSVREKSSEDGRDVGGQFLWMDVLEKRAGRWVIVRSTDAPVAAQPAPPWSPWRARLERGELSQRAAVRAAYTHLSLRP